MTDSCRRRQSSIRPHFSPGPRPAQQSPTDRYQPPEFEYAYFDPPEKLVHLTTAFKPGQRKVRVRLHSSTEPWFMKLKIGIGVFVLALTGALAAQRGAGKVPTFQVDPFWPKPLPNN